MQENDNSELQVGDDVFINFDCPHCQKSTAYLQETAGTIQVCPHCGQELIVPDFDGQSAKEIPLPIKTARLTLRPLQAEDFEGLVELLLAEESSQFMDQPLYNEEKIEHWLQNELTAKLTVNQRITLGIENDANHKLIGIIYLYNFGNTQRQMTLVVIIHPQYQNQKLGTEAVLGALNFCFRDIGQHRILASCDTSGLAAIRLLTRCGMRKEAECLKDHMIDGKWADSFWFAVLEEEFGFRSRQ